MTLTVSTHKCLFYNLGPFRKSESLAFKLHSNSFDLLHLNESLLKAQNLKMTIPFLLGQRNFYCR